MLWASERGKGSAILDIPSGFGRLAIPLARSGYTLTCVDISERFLSGLDKVVKAEKTGCSDHPGEYFVFGIERTI
ncbi:MAG: class I SAM-dependent methyltransferase [Puia sp.]